MFDFFEFLWNNTKDCIFLFEIQGVHSIYLAQANPIGIRFLGKPFKSCLGKNVCAIFPEERALDIIDACGRCLNNGGNTRYNLTLQMPGEEPTYWDASLTAMTRNDISYIIFWSKDITATVRLSRQREMLLKEYDCLFSSTSSGIGLLHIGVDGPPTLERANTTFMQMADLLNKYVPDIEAQFAEIVKKGENVAGQQCVQVGGRKRFYNCDVMFIREQGCITKAFVTIIHTTELVKFNKRSDSLLTDREKAMLELVCKGGTNKSIAVSLGVAEGTVKKTLYNAYRKLHVQSRAEAVKSLVSGQEEGRSTGK